MAAILIHTILILDLTGCQNVHETIEHFLQYGDLAEVGPVVDIRGNHCTIRYMVEGPETLTGLRQTLKRMAKGSFSDACGGQPSRPSRYNLPVIGHPDSLQKDNSDGLAAPVLVSWVARGVLEERHTRSGFRANPHSFEWRPPTNLARPRSG
jgi:hypothetical protein